jgi:hypothetical protein
MEPSLTLGRRELSAMLSRASAHACVFDFEAAETLARTIDLLARELPELDWHSRSARRLLDAIRHNRGSHLHAIAQRHDALRHAGGVDTPPALGGFFKVTETRSRMVVSGVVTEGRERVFVFVHDLLLGIVATEPGANQLLPGLRRFRFEIAASALKLFSKDEKLRIGLSTGDRLLVQSQGDICHWYANPNGQGGIEQAIRSGAVLTSHGEIGGSTDPGTVARWMLSYQTLRRLTQRAELPQPMLFYGSLLGAVREGRAIAHDDDLDVVLNLGRRTPGEAKAEMKRLIATLLIADRWISIELMGCFFKFRAPDAGDIDVFPAWHDGTNLWCPRTTCLPCEETLLDEAVETGFGEDIVLVPSRAETFLKLKYGHGWRVPDPTYRPKARTDIVYPFDAMRFTDADLAEIQADATARAGGEVRGTLRFHGR